MSSTPPRPKLKESNKGTATPAAVKDKTGHRALSDLFPNQEHPKAELVPVVDLAAAKQSEPKMRLTLEITNGKTVHTDYGISKSGPAAATPRPEVTSPSKLKHANPAANPADLKKSKNKNDESSSRKTVLVVIAALVVAALVFKMGFEAARHTTPTAEANRMTKEAALNADLMKNRARNYQNETGRRLNRERMNVEFENEKTAPPISESAVKVPGPNMMAGLPLVGERPTRREQTVQADPDYADSRTAYSLKEQEAANEWDRSARSQYVDEFVANAAKAGLKVKVDANGNVVVVGRLPAANVPTGSANAGGGALPQ